MTMADESEMIKGLIMDRWGREISLLDAHMGNQLSLLACFKEVGTGTWVEIGMSLWSRSYDSITVALGCLLNGYYVQSITVIRQVLEDQLTVAYAENHAEIVAKFYEDDGDFRKPTFTRMAQDVGWKWWGDHYAALSKYAHPRGFAVASKRSGNLLVIGPFYDEEIYREVLCLLMISTIQLTSLIAKLLQACDVIADEETIALSRRLFEERRRLKQMALALQGS